MKTKKKAIGLAILTGFWSWVYTFNKDAWKFWVCFSINALVVGFCVVAYNSSHGEGRAYVSIGAILLLFPVWTASWFWAVLDAVLSNPNKYGLTTNNWDFKKWARFLLVCGSIALLSYLLALTPSLIPTHSKYAEGSAEWYYEKAEHAIYQADDIRMTVSGNQSQIPVYFSDAIGFLNDAIKLAPDNAYYVYLRGRTYYSLRKDDLALADVNQAIQMQPSFNYTPYKLMPNESFEEILYNLRSYIYEDLGMREEAIADVKHAIAVAPYSTAEQAYSGRLRNLGVVP